MLASRSFAFPPRRQPGHCVTVPAAPMKEPCDGPAVFLGWRLPDEPSGFGFGPAPPAQLVGDTPLLYGGDGHLMTIAPTGAGKGVGVIIPTLLTFTGSAIVTDIKGENYQVTARRRREMGQQVVALDPFRLVTDGADALNPFDLFDLPGADPECDAEMLAAQLAVGHEFGSDRYWEDTGKGLLAGLIAHVATTAPPGGRNPTTLRKLLYHDDLDYHLAVQLDEKAVTSGLARDEFVGYLSAPTDRTRPCIRSTALTYVKCLGSRTVARALERSTFALRDLLEGRPLTVYLILPPEKLESHRALLRLWVATLLTAVVRRKRLPEQRTLFLLDEAAQLGRMPLLRQAITLLRGYGLQTWTFWQDLSQLRRLYPRDWPTLVGNAAVLQVFGVPPHAAGTGWSTLLGRQAPELARLGRDEMLLVTPDDSCRRQRRGNYLRDEMFAGLFDPNERFIRGRAAATCDVLPTQA
jgi:type IV secretion system protein VirD4